ncbi:sugar isomerase [Gemmatimonadota bacterium]
MAPVISTPEDKKIEFSPEFKQLGFELVVKPVLMYHLHKRKEAETWREWGGLKTQSDVDQESKRIEQELEEVKMKADFPVQFLPLTHVNTDTSAQAVSSTECDVILLYAAGSAGDRVYKQSRIDMITNSGKPIVVFLRRKSGPVYLWYEIAHTKLLRGATDKYVHQHVDLDDIVVDDYGDVTWRLRSLFGLKNIKKTKLVTVNGIGGWGEGGEVVSRTTGEIWNLDTYDVSLEEIGTRFRRLLNDKKVVENLRKEMANYLQQKSILSVNTEEHFILKAFILREVFKELITESNSVGITVRGCMSIGTTVQTTACLPFSLINDEGLMAFCESDFVVIPAGILLRYISQKPVFLNDPTFPYNGITTCAHCSAPRRMDGKTYEPTHIYTHCESDYGAAPKVEFRKNQVITNIIPDFNSKKWIGFKGQVTDSPFYDICRSQFECTIEGDWKRLLKDMQGFHWMTCYGDYLKEMGYALKKVGIDWEDYSNV